MSEPKRKFHIQWKNIVQRGIPQLTNASSHLTLPLQSLSHIWKSKQTYSSCCRQRLVNCDLREGSSFAMNPLKWWGTWKEKAVDEKQASGLWLLAHWEIQQEIKPSFIWLYATENTQAHWKWRGPCRTCLSQHLLSAYQIPISLCVYFFFTLIIFINSCQPSNTPTLLSTHTISRVPIYKKPSVNTISFSLHKKKMVLKEKRVF